MGNNTMTSNPAEVVVVVDEVTLVVLEAFLPLEIIVCMIFVMGNAEDFIHKAVHGWPKHICNDVWDGVM